jgi:stage II sporulation protein D
VGLADRLAGVAEERLGRQFPQPPKLKVYPTIDAFRDATGEPGWVGASTRGNVIRFQPIAALRARGSLDQTILHELLHALIESHANRRLPIWFSEGAAAYLAASTKANAKAPPSPPEDAAFLRTPDEARRAYAAASDCFAFLAARFGEPTVLGWLERGLPPAATQALARR